MEEKKYCLRCGKELSGRQEKYCSHNCSKLHLKSLYRKRRKEQVNAYNRKYRALGVRPLNKKNKIEMTEILGGRCFRCETIENLDLHHIKPARFGGKNTEDNLMLLCKSCHRKWHIMFNNKFWDI